MQVNIHKAVFEKALALVVVVALLFSCASSAAMAFENEAATKAEKLAAAAQADLSKLKGKKAIVAFGGLKLKKSHKLKLAKAIRSITKEGYSVGVVMYDLKSGQGVAYNSRKVFYSASTVKGPYVAALAKLKPRSVKTYKSIMRSTIVASSNDGYQTLLKHYGQSVLKRWAKISTAELKLDSRAYARYSARDLAKLWAQNYQFFSSGKAGAKTARAWFKAPTNSMIRSVFAGRYTTYSKPGWHPAYLKRASAHDAGIVMAGKNPYLLVVLSNTPAQNSKLAPIIKALDTIHRNR